MSEFKYGVFIPKIKQKFILNLLNNKKRVDNRDFIEYRKIKIKYGHIPNADGCAEVQLGNTIVIAGVKLDLTNPYPSEPDRGTLIVNAEFPPVASPDFEPGPPDENAIELARIIDRGLRKPEVVDFKKLCIVPGKKVYGLWIDIYALNHDGNLIDAAGIATMAALLTAKYTKVDVSPTGEIIRTNERLPLEVINFPVYITHVKIGEHLIIDPNLEEEMIADCKLTTIISNGNLIGGIQKSGSGALSIEDINQALENSLKIYPKIKEIITSSVK